MAPSQFEMLNRKRGFTRGMISKLHRCSPIVQKERLNFLSLLTCEMCSRRLKLLRSVRSLYRRSGTVTL